MLLLPAIVVGLASSLGSTQCAVDQPRTSSSSPTKKAGSPAKKAKGTVIRCHGKRSCDVTFRRATTERYYARLHGKVPPAVIVSATTGAACLLITHTITGHIVCAVGSSLVTKGLTPALTRAAATHKCLTIHVGSPAANATWRPISYGTTGGRDCAA